jgi:serine/threonine protein kinase
MATAPTDMTSNLPIEPLGGRYRVSGLVRSDQLGVVYRASDLAAGEAPRVVRVWLPSLARDSEFRAQLRQRSARLTVLAAQQAALPRLFHVEDTADGDHLLVTDHVEARSLGDWLSTTPPAEARTALQMAIRLGEAVEAVHNAGFVHGFLTPAHVEIREPDQQVRLGGLEYGALPARVLGQLDLDAPPFSREHLAPERQGGEEITEASDIYAYACLVRNLLGSVRLAHRLPAGVDRTVQGALASRPADRPRSIGEVLNELWGELAEEPAARARRWAFARRVGPAVLLGSLALAGASLWAVHRSGSKATAELATRPPVAAESAPVAAGAVPPAPTAQAVESAVAPPPSPPQLPVTDDRPAPAAAPNRAIEPPPRPVTAEGPASKRPARTQARTPDPDTGVVPPPPRPGAMASEAPRPPAADPRPTGPDRPPRREADDDAGSIIDWLLRDSRASRP